jgi:hypothetical protein
LTKRFMLGQQTDCAHTDFLVGSNLAQSALRAEATILAHLRRATELRAGCPNRLWICVSGRLFAADSLLLELPLPEDYKLMRR